MEETSSSALSVAQSRALNLFRYLRELVKLSGTAVHTLDKYEKVLWLSDVPREQECFAAAWATDGFETEDIWLEIKKPPIRSYPTLPAALIPWVSEDDIADSSDLPELHPSIVNPRSTDTPGTERLGSESQESTSDILEIRDHPHISELWEEYLEKEWMSWAVENERVKNIQSVYVTLHEIYQRQKTLGEMFDVVLGIGLLTRTTESGHKVRRHLIIAQASVELNGKTGTLVVKPAAQGAKPALEQDMLESTELPSREEQDAIREQVAKMGDDIWQKTITSEILNSWVHAVSADGVYDAGMNSPDMGSPTPKVTYAPALILRKRSERGRLRITSDIIEQLEQGQVIPQGVQRIIGTVDDQEEDDGDLSESGLGDSESGDIYFPLPSNDEQRSIIEKLRRSQGVLVQGPPGTGKSHTIANLVCHLLATGKRVLVTSQAPRALKVLKKMIPEEIGALCVNLLGKDAAALKDLEYSVQGITDRQYTWDAKRNERAIVQHERTLDQLRRQEAELRTQLLDIRERETRKHRICGGIYGGTAQRIAQRVAGERTEFGWIDNSVQMDDKPPLTAEEATELLRYSRTQTEERIEELKKYLAEPSKLPNPQQFVQMCHSEREAVALTDRFVKAKATDAYRSLLNASEKQRDELQEALQKILSVRSTVLKHIQPWVEEAVQDILAERDRKWRELLLSSKQHLDGLLERARDAQEWQVSIPQGRERSTMIVDARLLLDHLAAGHGLGVLVFRSKVARQTRYLTKNARVNGRVCNTTEAISALLETLEIDEKLDRLWTLWAPCVKRTDSPISAQIADFEDLCEPLEAALSLHELMARARAICEMIEGLAEPAWQETRDVEEYSQCIKAVIAARALDEASERFKDVDLALRNYLSVPNCHEVVGLLHQALTSRSEKAYGEAYTQLAELVRSREALDRRSELHRRLSSALPDLAARLSREPTLPCWDEQLPHIDKAWKWAQADTWIREYIGQLNEKAIADSLEETHGSILKAMELLASAKAWRHCLGRLTEKERQHLAAWAHEMGKIGKGTGKRAPIHRRAAREHMDHCRSAIPCWIMPLYQVEDTVTAKTDSFDVIIVDEASQCSPDALFLQFLGKKLVVVGDDEQISPPSFSGGAEVDSLQDRLLRDIPSAPRSALGRDSSFFDLANILFGSRIVLREHFRCMPEIIQFSNNLCYSNKPLLPLRQYEPKRLKPVIACHVRDGYRKGEKTRVVNPPEAEAIVQTIAKCCEDPAYAGKSMGVICLLGKQQAALIESMLLERLGAEEMESRNLVSGNAYAFQGDERDVMFLSMVAAGEIRALTGKPDRQQFNVAASRARDQMWLFHSPTISDLANKKCVRFKLLSYCLDPKTDTQVIDGSTIHQITGRARAAVRTQEKPPTPFDSWFEVDVFLKIVAKGYRVIPQFETAGYRIDLVVQGMTGQLAVECDGDYHDDPSQIERDVERERRLRLHKWTFWRIPHSKFNYDKDQAMQSLWDKLKELSIAPGGKDIVRQPAPIAIPPVPQQQDVSPRREAPLQLPTRTTSRLKYRKEELEKAIVSALEACPNKSCTKKSMTTKVLRALNPEKSPRGGTRKAFERQLKRVLKGLENAGVVEEYKATNIRIRLIGELNQNPLF